MYWLCLYSKNSLLLHYFYAVTALQTALEANKLSEALILKYLEQGVRADINEDETPVLIAHQEAEAIIKQVILAEFPGHTFYGDEGEKINLENHQGFTRIIDPIDVTKSYLRKNFLFGTQLALMHDTGLIIGISNAPLMGELIYAEKGGGCFCNGVTIQVSDIDAVEDAYMSYGSLKYFTRTKKMMPY